MIVIVVVMVVEVEKIHEFSLLRAQHHHHPSIQSIIPWAWYWFILIVTFFTVSPYSDNTISLFLIYPKIDSSFSTQMVIK
ncbi:MAG: hypothetical protein PHI32_14330 [Dysgonamonadaceae bacterium]|nr:hypothetical protein [Dysgonamonadaceae bacterium]